MVVVLSAFFVAAGLGVVRTEKNVLRVGWIFIAWACATLLAILVGRLLSNPMLTTLMAVVLASLFVAAGCGLARAKKNAMEFGNAHTWFGLMQISAWDPTEGVLFLKDKKLDFVDSNPNDGGGIRILLPFSGEEEVCRVPLEVQTCEYSEDRVLTREYVPISITGTIYWRIVDVARFYILVSREIHKVNDRDGHKIVKPEPVSPDRGMLRSGTPHQLDVAREWLRQIAEEQTRLVVARVRTGLLAAENVASSLSCGLRDQITFDSGQKQVASALGLSVSGPGSSKSYRSAAEALGDVIRQAMECVVPEYGIHVDRVSVQDVRLPQDILNRAIYACTTAYRPIEAQREAVANLVESTARAEGNKRGLAAEAEIIGSDAVGKREVVGSVQPFAFGGRYGDFMDFLNSVFEKGKKD